MAVVYTPVPASITISGNTDTTFFFITSSISTLDSADPVSDATTIYKNALANAEGLLSEYQIKAINYVQYSLIIVGILPHGKIFGSVEWRSLEI